MSDEPASEVTGAESTDSETPHTPTPGDAPETEALAPLGGPAEAEPPQHTVDPDRLGDGGIESSGIGTSGTAGGAGVDGALDPAPVEDSIAYELAVEDGAALAAASGASGSDPDARQQGPEFRAPGAP